MMKNIEKIQLFNEWGDNYRLLKSINEAFQERDLDEVLELTDRWLSKELDMVVTHVSIIEYVLQNFKTKLYGVRFLCQDTSVFRLNWSRKPKRESMNIESVDFWLSGKELPDYHLNTTDLNIVQVLTAIKSILLATVVDNGSSFDDNIKNIYIDSYLQADEYINNISQHIDESLTPEEESEFKQLNSIYKVEGKEGLNSKDIERLVVLLSKRDGYDDLTSDIFKFDKVTNEVNIDDKYNSQIDDLEKQFAKEVNIKQKFKDLRLLLGNTAFMKSIIITGTPGVGKTYTVMETMKELGLREKDDFVKISGKTTTLGLYQQLYKYRDDKILIFDDCDDVLENVDGFNILKAALGDDPVRSVYWLSQRTFDPDDYTEEETNELIKEGKTPSSFDITSSVIFISNKTKEDLLSNQKLEAVLSRSNSIDMTFTEEEILSHLKTIVPHINIFGMDSVNEKMEVYNVMVEAARKGLLTMPIDIRTFMKMCSTKVLMSVSREIAARKGEVFEYGVNDWIRIAASYS